MQGGGDLPLLVRQLLLSGRFYLLNVRIFFFSDALDLGLEQHEIWIELVDDILLDLSSYFLLIDLILLLCSIRHDLS